MWYVKALTVTNIQMIITKIGCRIGQSCKTRCDVLICTGVKKPCRSRNVPNNKMSIGLLGTVVRLGTMKSCVAKVWAQLAADILLSRPLSNPYVAPLLLPIIWPPVCSRLEPVLVIVAVTIGTPIATRMPLLQLKFELWWDMARWAEGCGVGSSGGCDSRGEDNREEFALMEWRELLCRNSWVRRWLWRSAYNSNSAFVIRLVTKSLNSQRRPQNTYRLKSSGDMGWPVAANSSNNDFVCYMYILTDESPCQRSWKEP